MIGSISDRVRGGIEWMRTMNAYERSRLYTTALICFTVFFLFADQNLLAPNLSAVAKDFGFSEREKDEKLGGEIALGFFIVGGPAALIVGYFADTVSRHRLFGIVVLLGEAFCLGTYWVRNFDELLVCRVFTGISIGGAIPIIFSMLGDLYPGTSRVFISTIVSVFYSAGVSAGQLIAGVMGPAVGWRAPFLVIAAPALLCAALMFFTVDEPKRGDQERAVRQLQTQRDSATRNSAGAEDAEAASTAVDSAATAAAADEDGGTKNVLHGDEKSSIASKEVVNEQRRKSNTIEGPSEQQQQQEQEHQQHQQQQQQPHQEHEAATAVEYDESISWQKLRVLFSTPTAVLSYLQGIPGCVPWGMIFVFLNDYFSDDRGLSVQAATYALTIFGAGGLVGQGLGGALGQWLYNRFSPRYQCLLMGASTLLGILPMLYLLNTTTDVHSNSIGGFYFMAFLAGLLVSITGPNVRGVLQNVCAPEVRGTAFAVFSLTDDVGKGLGPAMVNWFIQAFNGNRQDAYNVVVLFWLWCGVLLLAMMFTYETDEARMNAAVAKAVAAPSSSADDDAVVNVGNEKAMGDSSGDVEHKDIEMQDLNFNDVAATHNIHSSSSNSNSNSTGSPIHT